MDAGRSRCHQTNCSTDWSSLLVLPPTKTSESGVLCDTLKIFLCEYERMPKVSVEIPRSCLMTSTSTSVTRGKFVNRSDAIRASIRKTLDMLDEIDERHGRVETDEAESH